MNLIFPIINSVQIILFTTGAPPSGGTALITPDTGFVNITEFTITIADWQSNSGNVMFRIWNTLDPAGLNLGSVLSSYISASDNFTFTSSNTNPFSVEVIDDSNEVAWT